jgi:glycine/serine hydroxymethyltransferase
MKEKDMVFIGDLIDRVLTHMDDEKEIHQIKNEIHEFSKGFLIYQNG